MKDKTTIMPVPYESQPAIPRRAAYILGGNHSNTGFDSIEILDPKLN